MSRSESKHVTKMAWLGLLFLTAVLTSLGLWWQRGRASNIRHFTTVRYQDQSFQVVIAQTPTEIVQGLSDRPTIGADGLLFILPRASQPQFWMYKMQFPLDFIWINKDKIVDLHGNIPAPLPQTPLAEIARVQPRTTVTHVLEVPAGFIARHGITIGDTLTIDSRQRLDTW